MWGLVCVRSLQFLKPLNAPHTKRGPLTSLGPPVDSEVNGTVDLVNSYECSKRAFFIVNCSHSAFFSV